MNRQPMTAGRARQYRDGQRRWTREWLRLRLVSVARRVSVPRRGHGEPMTFAARQHRAYGDYILRERRRGTITDNEEEPLLEIMDRLWREMTDGERKEEDRLAKYGRWREALLRPLRWLARRPPAPASHTS